MQVVLTVIEGPHKGETFAFAEHDCFLVGRSSDAHFRLAKKDPHFSRRHFLVEVNPPLCRLTDMGSMNGTLVNGRRVETVDLRDGDIIEGGLTKIRAELKSAPEVPAPEEILSLEELATFRGARPEERPRELDTTRAWDGDPPIAVHPDDRHFLPDDYLERAHACDQPYPGYRVIKELGRGGMGIVYLAICEANTRVVALKSIVPAAKGTAAELQRFMRELSILRELSHPHIAAYRDQGTTRKSLFFAMEYVPGANISQLLKQQGPMPVARAVPLICQLLQALEFAHRRGFVHRDVKPANLLVAPRRDGETLKLTDFGLARAYQATRFSGLTMTGDVGGTVPFMAPEQITHYREVQPAADEYSAAATLYYMLTGRFVYNFPREVGGQIALILTGQPISVADRREDLPAELAAAIDRALQREPADRFPTAEAFRMALAPWG